MKHQARFRLLFGGVLLAAMVNATAQEVLTPASYFECQISAQEATLRGMEERTSQMGRHDVTAAEKRVADEMARHRVTLAIYQCGRQSAGTLGAYAHRNADELATWLAANPQVKARLEEVGRRIASLSSRMQSASPPATR